MNKPHLAPALLLLSLTFGAAPPLRADAPKEGPYRRVSAVTHVHSLFSPNGRISLNAIAAMAEDKGIDVLIPTDHLTHHWEYGIPPLGGLLRGSVTQRSVLQQGPANVLHFTKNLQREKPSLLIIPGLEVTPAYHWSGHLFEANLTLEEPQRHLLVLGLDQPEDLDKFPVLSNRQAGTVDWKRFVLPLAVIGAGLALMIRWPAGLLIAAFGLLWTLNQRPFRRLPPAYETFSRNGYDAAQGVIDYAAAHGAVTVWAHPEAPNWEEPRVLYRSVRMRTRPYPEALIETRGYTGFAYFWEGEKVAGAPGGTWDQTTAAFLRGERKAPAWAFGELDWNGDASTGVAIDTMQNVLWVKEKSSEAVLEAFRAGRFYVYFNGGGAKLSVERWDAGGEGARAMSGETVAWTPGAKLRLAVRQSGGAAATEMQGEVLRNGASWKNLKAALPLTAEFPLPEPDMAGNGDWYRFVLKGGGSALVGNPIFVKGRTGGTKG